MYRIVRITGLMLFAALLASGLILTACGGGGGSKIAFTSTRTGISAIYVMNQDGSSQTHLASGGTVRNYYPAWSPDHKKIAYSSGATGHAEIYVVNADGSNQVRLTDNTWDDTHPSWSPDGRWILCVGFSKLESDILLVENFQ